MAQESYGTVQGWRNFSGLDSTAITTARATIFLDQSIQQVTRECSQLIRDELTVRDGDTDYFFTRRRYLSDYETASPDAEIGTDDVKVYEFDSTNKILVDISAQVNGIDGLNCYYTLNTGYPTSNRQVYTTYRIVGQPLSELVGAGSVLQKAVYNFMTVLSLKELKLLRLKSGIISYTSGGETVTRSEADVDTMIEQHLSKYKSLINYCKPFYGRGMRTGSGHAYRRLPRNNMHSDGVWDIINRN